MLAIRRMNSKRVLVCIGRLSKTHTGIIAHTDKKVLVNKKAFCIFTIYNYKGAGRKEGTI